MAWKTYYTIYKKENHWIFKKISKITAKGQKNSKKVTILRLIICKRIINGTITKSKDSGRNKKQNNRNNRLKEKLKDP